MLAFTCHTETTKKKEEKQKHKILVHGSRQHLTCSLTPSCLRCRTLVDTNVLPYVRCCSAQGQLKAVLLYLRHVDTTVAFGSWFVPSWCAQKKKSRLKKQKLRRCLYSSELAELMIHLALTVSLQEEHPPKSPVHLAVGTPQCHDLDREERLCRALATLTQTHTRALPAAAVDIVLLYCDWLWCCYYLYLALSSLVTCDENTKIRKKNKRQKEKR